MNIQKAFTYMFDDKEWLTKMGIGAVLALIPIVNFAWVGYMVETMKRVMNNDAELLPDWSDFGKKFTDGLLTAAAGLVYSLPMIVLICIPMGLMMGPALFADASGGNMDGFAEAMMATGSVAVFCLSCLIILFAVALSIIFPVLQLIYVRENNFGAFFKVREAMRLISANTSNFFMAWIVNFLAASVITSVVGTVSGVLALIPCIGWVVAFGLTFLMLPYIGAIQSYLFGDFGRVAFEPKTEITPAA